MSQAPLFLWVSSDARRLSSGWSEVGRLLVDGGVQVELAHDDQLDVSELEAAGVESFRLPLGRGRAGMAMSAVLLATRAAERSHALVHVLDPGLEPLALGALTSVPSTQAVFSMMSGAEGTGRLATRTLRAWVGRNGGRTSAVLLDHAARDAARALGVESSRWHELPAELGVASEGLALEEDPASLRAASRRRLGLTPDSVVVALALSTGAPEALAAAASAIRELHRVRPAWSAVVLLRERALPAREALEKSGARIVARSDERALLWHAADLLWLPVVGEHEALLEAALARVPAVACPGGPYVDLVRDGETGWLRDGIVAQRDALVRAMERGSERAAAGAAARSRAMRGWERGLCVERLLRAYDAVLTGETPRARLDLSGGRIVGESGLERRRRELVRPGGAGRPRE